MRGVTKSGKGLYQVRSPVAEKKGGCSKHPGPEEWALRLLLLIRLRKGPHRTSSPQTADKVMPHIWLHPLPILLSLAKQRLHPGT